MGKVILHTTLSLDGFMASSDDNNVSLLGASIDQQCLKAGLVDEIVLHVAPILLGEGVRLFDHLGNEPIELERAGIVSQTGITSLRFCVIKTQRMRNLI